MNSPLISIIVPVYNTEKYLDQCIQSVLAQTYTNWELLLIDDGSTDSSGVICDKYTKQDSRIRVFHKVNGGVSSARNLGLDNAKGEWITFVDADDILYTHGLSTLFANSKDADIITATIETDNRVWTQSYIGIVDCNEYVRYLLNGTCFGYLYATLYRSAIFRCSRTNIPNNIKIGEDVLFKIDIARHISKALNIADVIYWYRTNSTSVMQTSQRSVQYYFRYFQLRNSLISADLAQTCTIMDIETLINAFYNPNIPYRNKDYKLLRDMLSCEKLDVAFSPQLKKRIEKLNNKSMVILSKTYYYCKNYLYRLLFQTYTQYTILD